MSDELVLNNIEIVKKKLKKYTALKEHGKVREYLHKLNHISISPSLIQETRIDRLLRKLASHKTTNYSSTARHILKKWHHRRLLPKSTTTTDVNKPIVEEKSDDNTISESQSSDDNKKRRVLSLAQYLESKKPVLSPSSSSNSTRKRLTDSQIEMINAQFQATTEKLTATASNLPNNILEVEKINTNPILKKPIIEQTKSKSIDLWAEDEDDDDDDNDDSISNSD